MLFLSAFPRTKSHLKEACHKLIPQRTRKPSFECQYCCEQKCDYKCIALGTQPYGCDKHFSSAYRVCKTCMDAALAAQFDCKPLLEVGCPECGTAWDPDEVKWFLGMKNQKRFKALERQARKQVLLPEELPDGATVDALLNMGTRFW